MAKKNYLKGAAILAMGGIIAKFLGMFFKLPLVRIIDDFGVGLYSNAYPIYSFLLSVSVIGIPVAISKMVSERASLGYYDGAYKVFRVSFMSLTAIGAISTLIMFFGANFFINIFSWHEDTYYSIIGLSLAPFFVCMFSTYKGFFQGMQNMVPPSSAQIVESTGRVVIGLGGCILLLGMFNSIPIAAGAASFGATAGAIIAFFYLFICFLFYKPKLKEKINSQKTHSNEVAKDIFITLLKISIPITLASLVTSSMNIINSVTVSGGLQSAGYTLEQATILWGQLASKAQTLISIPLILSSALAASLVPAISEAFIKKQNKDISKKVYIAFKVVFMLAIPCIIGLSVLSEEIVDLLFGDPSGHEMVRFLSFSILTTMLSTTMQSVLQGVGVLKRPLINLGIGCVVKLILNIFLIANPALNIYGAIIGTIVADSVIVVLHYITLRKQIKIEKGLILSVIKAGFCGITMGIIAIALMPQLSLIIGTSLSTLVIIAICAVVYVGSLYMTKTLDFDELKSVVGR